MANSGNAAGLPGQSNFCHQMNLVENWQDEPPWKLDAPVPSGKIVSKSGLFSLKKSLRDYTCVKQIGAVALAAIAIAGAFLALRFGAPHAFGKFSAFVKAHPEVIRAPLLGLGVLGVAHMGINKPLLTFLVLAAISLVVFTSLHFEAPGTLNKMRHAFSKAGDFLKMNPAAIADTVLAASLAGAVIFAVKQGYNKKAVAAVAFTAIALMATFTTLHYTSPKVMHWIQEHKKDIGYGTIPAVAATAIIAAIVLCCKRAEREQQIEEVLVQIFTCRSEPNALEIMLRLRAKDQEEVRRRIGERNKQSPTTLTNPIWTQPE
ncbi:MAG: hypothetical protein H7A36_00600 [Chlamydiales bacterium]|nr:hypothetical protein [Chlamydiales bacterium]